MNSKHRFLIILNPTAAKGKAGERRAELEGLLAEAGLDYELRLTERPGHATELAAEAGGRGFSCVVSGGGDGTANEVVNGLMQAKAAGGPVPALGTLSIGRGNDFAYGADVPDGLAACVATLAAGAERPMDVGIVSGGDYPQGKHFCNGIGIGFDTRVGLEAATMKHVHGFMAYVFGALRTFAKWPESPLVKVSLDGQVIERKSTQISIMNGKRMGGTFYMAPKALNHDGLFDLCMSAEVSRVKFIGLMARYMNGTQDREPGFKIARADRFLIEAPEGGLICHADGETICIDGTGLDVRCLPGALRAIYDPGIGR